LEQQCPGYPSSYDVNGERHLAGCRIERRVR
jgi:hypothetical protein